MSPRAWQKKQDLLAQSSRARVKHAKIHARKAEIRKAMRIIEQGVEPEISPFLIYKRQLLDMVQLAPRPLQWISWDEAGAIQPRVFRPKGSRP